MDLFHCDYSAKLDLQRFTVWKVDATGLQLASQPGNAHGGSARGLKHGQHFAHYPKNIRGFPTCSSPSRKDGRGDGQIRGRFGTLTGLV